MFASFVAVDDAAIKPIALSLAFGVLVDAFLVRMTLVPAVLALAGRGAWWLPRILDRTLPHLDIEGERLRGAGQSGEGAEVRASETVPVSRPS
ncbi:MMPL family transporter [Actinomadura sp. NPDC047616]|uniref:MMPL family transporter n=1 Tax=Actinomadura sp. NPDC047616 TaxID=3155914 RepID=UPI003409C725